MLPPLASTSCTDMLILFLLLTNGLLFDMHKFELKKEHILKSCARASLSTRYLIAYLVEINIKLLHASACITSPILPRRARGYSSDAEYPGVTDSVARCYLRWFRAQTQHAHLTDVTVAVTYPDVLRSLSVRQRRCRASKLKARSRFPDGQRPHEFRTRSPVSW